MEKEKEESLRLAIAVSLLRSKIQNRLSSSSTSLCDAPSETDPLRWKQKNRRSSSSTSRCGAPPSDTDALRWKQKAKERKKEIIRLQEDLKDAESCDLFPANASCKCYFFDNLGEFSGRRIGEASEPRFNDALRRRFLRIARIRGRRKSTRPSQRLRLSGLLTSEPEYEDEAEQLRISIDFLLELSQAADSSASYFSNWSHQAVDFILGNTIQSLDLQTNNLIPELQFPFIGSLCCTYETNVCSCSSSYNNMLALFLHTQASLKKLISMGRTLESVEESISFMITQLIARMCTPFKGNGSFSCLSMILTVFLFLKPKITSSLSPRFFTTTVIASPPTSPPFRQIPNHSVFLSSSTVHLGLTVLQTSRWNLVCFESISVAKALADTSVFTFLALRALDSLISSLQARLRITTLYKLTMKTPALSCPQHNFFKGPNYFGI
ncbi:hypothetical protein DY000_02017711 [Brassica cretica]|uniref:DOG1 domain-containing protein n=1 Tax=Brassica cretica TaxID=69181 RepID=A0ABQ7CSM2_BRACR|nr:hypothetical protein DY000_02017711 [Brassica cretica]